MENNVYKRRAKGTENVRNERKRKRTSGEQYNNYKNITVSEKKPPDVEVHCKCKYYCRNLTYDHKKHLFQEFYKTDRLTQGTYLLGLIHIVPIKRRRHGTYEDPAESNRQSTVCYTIPDGEGDHKQVCRNTFADIFNLTHKRIQILCEKKKRGDTTYTDARGKNKSAAKFTEEDKKLVVEHINSFPREESHYSRHKTAKEYLSPDLNISRLYRSFKLKYPDTKLNYRYYSTVFHQNFPKLKFGHPRSDTCSTCDYLNIQIKAARLPRDIESAKNNLALHHRKSEKSMQMMKNDIKNSQEPTSTQCTITIDLQQVLFVPTLTHGDMFYLRQLSCYNLGIHISDTNEAFMCLWHEGITGRGGNEISSCLMKVKSNITNKKILNVWSDNCIGQNKNKMMLLTLILLVKEGIFEEINHKFLVKGHTYLPCDRDFALIEKRKRLTKTFIPDDLEEMIKTTRHNNPFKVIKMKNEDFLDFKSTAELFLNTTKLNISKACWIKVSAENPTTVNIRRSFNEMEQWSEINILKKGKKKDFAQLVVPQLACKSNISAEKKENLKSMIDFMADENHKNFYKNLLN